jgi:trigger factor
MEKMRKTNHDAKKTGMPRILLCLLLAGIMAMTLSLAACGSATADSSASGTAGSSGTSDSTASGASTDSNADLAAETVDETIEDKGISNFIKLGGWTGLTLEKTVSASSSDSSTDTGTPAIVSDISSYTFIYPDDTAIENGMTANIDYVGKIDGTAFDGGSATGTDLTIGSNKFIDGFEDQLIGHKKGETVTVNVTFPSNYDKTELAGKAAEFTVTINKVKADPWSYIAEDSTVLKYPKDIVDLWTTQVAAAYSYYASTYSMDASYYKAAAGITTTDEEQAKINTKSYLMSKAIMDAEGVTTDSDEYQNILSAVLTASGYSTESDAAAAGISEQMIDITVSYYTAYDLMVQKAKVTEVESTASTAASAAASTAASTASSAS